MGLRVGLGYDVHPFAKSGGRDRLVVGGMTFEGERGLTGHSDADPVCHALCDALLGAMALGDLGTHFPDTDPTWKDADGIDLLRRTVEKLKQAGGRAVNADITVLAERPLLAPRIGGMRERLSAALGIPSSRVSVKATRPEGLGALGRGEGLAAMAVVLVETADDRGPHVSREDP